MHCTPDLSKYLYDDYVELSIRQSTYLHFIKICFWSFFFFCLELIPLWVFYFILFDSVNFCVLDKTAISPHLDRMISCTRWALLISPAQVPSCLSNFCDFLSCLLCWACAKSWRVSKERITINLLDADWLEAGLSGTSKESMLLSSFQGETGRWAF